MNGILNYNEAKYLYVVNEGKLILNRIKEQSRYIPLNLVLNIFEDNFETPSFLIGHDFTTNKKIKFYISSMHQSKIDCFECNFYSYLLYENETETFDKIKIEHTILTEFHLYEEKLQWSFDMKDNAYKIKMNNSPDEFEFQVGKNIINTELYSSFSINFKKIQPFEMKTFMDFNFKATNDIKLIDEITNITNEFLCFVTNTNNHRISKLNLFYKQKRIGIYFINEAFTNNPHVEENCIIHFSLIKNSLGNLFNDIANTKIYTNHIKESNFDTGILTYSRIIMLAAGFEWQFNNLEYPIEKDIEKNINYKKELDSFLDGKINEVAGQEKKYYKKIKSLVQIDIESLTLSKKIRYALENHEEILSPFIEHLYKLNSLNYPKMYDISECIANTRNIIAHGNLNKDIPENAVLDYRILQFLYYAMTLKSIDIPTFNIQNAINKLFKINIRLN